MTARAKDRRPAGPAAASFARGFRQRNPLVLVAAGLLLVPALLGLEALFTSGAWTLVPMKYYLRKASDDYVYVSYTVDTAKREALDVPAIYILGGSTARESITSGAGLAGEIEADGGPACKAFDLGSMNQNFAQSLVVADNVPTRKPAWIIIGINPGRFTPDRGSSMMQSEGRELILKSDFLRSYVARTYGRYEHTYTILPGIFSYATSWLQNVDGLGRRQYGQHRYNLRNTHTVKQKERMVKIWNTRRYKVFKRNLRFNLAMLEQLIVRCRQRDLHVVLLELPSNRAIIGDRFDYAIKQYREPCERLAQKYDVPYVDFSSELKLTNDDFHDLSHLIEPGRVIWQHRLAQELARLMGPDGEGAAQ